MFFGWELFEYKKKIEEDKDYFSFCKTKITQFTQPIFEDDSCDKIFIVTSPSKELELAVDEKYLKVRLLIWDQNTTISIVLEKLEIENINILVLDKKSIQIEKKFELQFYNHEDMLSFGNNFRTLFYKTVQNKKGKYHSRVRGDETEHEFSNFCTARFKDLQPKLAVQVVNKNTSKYEFIKKLKLLSKTDKLATVRTCQIQIFSFSNFIEKINLMTYGYTNKKR